MAQLRIPLNVITSARETKSHVEEPGEIISTISQTCKSVKVDNFS